MENRTALLWGTFDLLHEGHRGFLAWARRQAEYVHAVVLPDEIARIKREPMRRETIRLSDVSMTGLVDSASLDCVDWGLRTLRDRKFTHMLLGHDQPEIWVRKAEEILGVSLAVRRAEKFGDVTTTKLILERASE